MDLTAQNMVSTATKTKKDAEMELKKILAKTGTKYAVCSTIVLNCAILMIGEIKFQLVLNGLIHHHKPRIPAAHMV